MLTHSTAAVSRIAVLFRIVKPGVVKTFFIIGLHQGQVLVASYLALRLLGTAEFGRITLLSSALAALTIIGAMSSGVAAYGYAARIKNNDSVLFSQILSVLRRLLTATSALAVLTACIGSKFFPEKLPFDAVAELAAGALFLFASICSSYQQGALLGLNVLDRYLKINVLFFLITPFLVGLCVHSFGLAGYFFSLALSFGTKAILVERVICQSVPVTGVKLPPQEVKQLWSFIVPATIASVTTLPAQWFAYAQLFASNGGDVILGVVGMAILIKQIPLLVCLSFISSQGRTIFADHDQPQKAKSGYRRLVLKSVGLGLVLLGLAAVVLWLYWWLWPSADARFSREVFEVIVFAKCMFFLELLGAAIYVPFTSHRLMWQSFFGITLPRDLLSVLLSFFLVPAFGWHGFVAAMLVPLSLTMVLVYVVGAFSKPTRIYFLFER